MAMHDDLCLVCADPLEFTAFGSCGHKEVCSKCVARMRFVLKERGCVFCRQENAQVFFTRFMGDYTARMAPEELSNLQARADRKELYALAEISGFFDDEKHFQDIRALCGFTHPVLEAGGVKSAPKFNNFNSLKRHIETTHGEFFCDVCLQGRKVFVSEQLLYSKESLRRHQESGDESGPLAESGFKGHPLCKFCRTRFYDSNELYKHMEGSHENCFLCKRAAPDKYVYYRHYKELEDHFTKDHHPCPHPACLERKFVVFNTEYELKAHFAAEHGDEMKMSAAQRRQALTIPLQLQYRSRDDEQTEPMVSAHLERAATIIGGGHNIGSRAARHGRGGTASGMHHSRSEPQIAHATSTSGQEGPSEVSSVTFTVEDFPAPSSSQQTGAGPMGRWAAFAGSQGGAGSLSEHDFPSLPTLSRNQRRRIKEQQRTLADRLSAAAQPPRVLNRAMPGGGSGAGTSTAYAAAGSYSQIIPGAADFPALRETPTQTASLTSATSPLPMTASLLQSQPASSSSAGTQAADVSPAPAKCRPPGFGQEAFPALRGGVGTGSAQRTAAPMAPPSSAYSSAATGSLAGAPGPSLSQADVLNSLFMRPGSAAATSGASAMEAFPLGADAVPQLMLDDFPSLPGGKNKASAKPKAAKIQANAKAFHSAEKGAVAAPSGGGTGGVSDCLKSANKALVARIKQQLSGTAFGTFRQQSMLFMHGDLTAGEYHDYMVSLGMLSLVAELVSLCPDPTKRRLLLDVHRAFICSPAAQDPGLVGAGWMPPEAAVAKANRVTKHSAWSCQRCNLCNAPDDGRCEACGTLRPSEEEQLAAVAEAMALESAVPAFPARGLRQSEMFGAASGGTTASKIAPRLSQDPPAANDFPPLSTNTTRSGPAAVLSTALDSGFEGVGTASPGSNSSKTKKGKGTTIKIGMPTSGASGSGVGQRANPQNAWSQSASKTNIGNSWSGQGIGKLAKMHGALNDAWE